MTTQDKDFTYGDFLHQHDAEISRINDAILETDFHPISDIYIDLANLKDTRMGTLLLLSSSKEETQYLIDNLDAYNYRPVRNFTFTYPKYSLSESKLIEMYSDPKLSDDIFVRSPDTDLSLHCEELAKLITQHNSRVKYRPAPVLHLNVYPLIITDNIKIYADMLEAYLKGSLTIDLFSVPPGKVDASLYKKCGMLFIDKMLEVTYTTHSLYKVLFEDRNLLNSEIYAPYDSDITVIHKWEQYNINFQDSKALSELYAVTEALLNLYCHFKFNPFCIPAPHPKER